jgi:hypothetical protein
MNTRSLWPLLLASLLVGLVATVPRWACAAPLSYQFTYQGQLQESSSPVNGSCDVQFSLWDAAGGGSQIGNTQGAGGLNVVDGLFTALLDFGSGPFSGDDRWLQIAIRCPDGSGSYSTLSPRQKLTAAPYALYAPLAGNASDLACSACVGNGDLANGAVTASKIASATIQMSNLAFAPGTVTSITAGTGLTGGTVTVTGTIGVNFGTTEGTVAEGNHTHDASYWKLGGNTGTSPASNFVGTGDSQPLELRVNGQRALRLEPADSPNVIGGYSGNNVTPGVLAATICGGGASGGVNRVTDYDGTVCGGYGNQAGDGAGSVSDRQFATVGGGGSNTAAGWGDTISGGAVNQSSGYFSVISGGYTNSTTSIYSVVGGGEQNITSGRDATIGGGFGNRAAAPFATIGGGGRTDENNPATGNLVTDDYGTIAGGGDNQAGNDNMNTTDAVGATVGGGGTNFATNAHATIGGGFLNVASGLQSTVGGGTTNVASGNVATVPGGFFNSAEGTGSFAAGVNAHATHSGSFVWSDGTASAGSTGNNTFNVLATGGLHFQFAGPFEYCDLKDATGWHCSPSVSDRNAKANFADVDQRVVLMSLAQIPIQTWNYRSDDPSLRHMGPMAQDFYAAFAVGADDKHIDSIDANGVALAAIQGLYQLLQEKDAQIAALAVRVEALEHDSREACGR